jgi:cytochrome c556
MNLLGLPADLLCTDHKRLQLDADPTATVNHVGTALADLADSCADCEQRIRQHVGDTDLHAAVDG